MRGGEYSGAARPAPRWRPGTPAHLALASAAGARDPPGVHPAPCLFDLDGTLADTLADIAATTNHVRRVHGLPPAPLATVRTFVGDGARTLLRRALHEALPADPAAAAAAVEASFAVYVEHHEVQCTASVRAYPGVAEHLAALAARGHGLAVVTNKAERFAVAIVRHLGLDGLLRVVVGGDTLARRKPDPAPLALALQRLGWTGPGGTMAGDGVQDLRAAKALGLATVACLYGYGDPARLRGEGADLYWRAFGVPE
ncbi:MAG: HAD family hydrolase [Planctomycetes bacterium]|nr:HAD family hydrolase [Planctomycetota bacterium]